MKTILKPGEAIKLKYHGVIDWFVILGPQDIIEADDLQCLVLQYNPLCYSETLAHFKKTLRWQKASAYGEKISDWHTNRIYLRRLEKDFNTPLIYYEILNNDYMLKQYRPQRSETQLFIAIKEGRKAAIKEWKEVYGNEQPKFLKVAFYASKSKFLAKQPFRVDVLYPSSNKWEITGITSKL